MLLKLVDKLPEGDRWHYEVKWDGYRGIVVINRDRVQLISRNEKDLSKRFRVIVDALKKLDVESAVLDVRNRRSGRSRQTSISGSAVF